MSKPLAECALDELQADLADLEARISATDDECAHERLACWCKVVKWYISRREAKLVVEQKKMSRRKKWR